MCLGGYWGGGQILGGGGFLVNTELSLCVGYEEEGVDLESGTP